MSEISWTWRASSVFGSRFLTRGLVATLALIALSACNDGPWPRAPDPAIVDQIEAKLTRVPCIGAMSRWARRYHYQSEPRFIARLFNWTGDGRWYDFTKLEIDYAQAGFEEFRAGRTLYREMPFPGIDDRQFDGVSGEYDIPSQTARITYCGPNMTDTLPKDLNILVR